jgi:hypothetical protein
VEHFVTAADESAAAAVIDESNKANAQRNGKILQ